MATTATHLLHKDRFSAWFPDFLWKELAPYPGRAAVVARMVIAATITTILIVTFRIPGGAIGVLCAFLLSRENLLSTAESALYLLAAFVIGTLFIPVGARLFASIPITHFLWEAVSIFLAFFLLKTLTNYALSLGLCTVATNVLSIWYLPGPAERNVELTLWQVAATLIGVLVTFGVEIIFHAFHDVDEVVEGVDARLQQIRDLMEDYAANRSPSTETTRMLTQYAVVGMGALRRHIARMQDEPAHRIQMSALVSLTGRATDFAAALCSTVSSLSAEERRRAAEIAQRILDIQRSLKADPSPLPEPDVKRTASTPLLSELEAMIALIPSVLAGESAVDPRLQILDSPPSSRRILVEDAFTNPEHLRFVLSGTLAAMLCYVLYVSLNWPGISTSVTTCVFTALTNVGASRQKQVLRIAGALLGGFFFGLGAQIFILPNIDSISGFAALIAVVTTVAAWISTSSSRLSYAGLQIALAFYLINLSEFRIQTSLTVGRDRAIGVLLGIIMMWLVFERFYSRPAGDEMVRVFIRNVRLMAELIKTSSGVVDTSAIVKIRKQRDQIYRYFGDVTAQADAVPFETGPTRAGHMAARDRIRRWQAALRTFYLLETPLLQFRTYGDLSRSAGPFVRIDDAFREECARALEDIGSILEKQLDSEPYDIPVGRKLSTLLGPSTADGRLALSEREEALLRILRTIASLLDRIQDEIRSEPLYATE